MVTVGQLIADRYELKHVVGTGGMSSVYCAHDTLLERDVALKILHEHFSEDGDYVERFRREARAAARLSHPGIVTVIDRGEEDGRQFIVFEFVDGETLKELVDRGGPMPVRRALELGLEIGRALAFAHQQGLVHRDVKPQNVLLNGDGRAQVTDFGIARSLDAVGHTETGTVLGTSHYIAPEQARGERVDAQTDVYSFGVVLYELLAGEVPYGGDNFLTVAMKHVNEPVPSLLERRTDCPLRLAALVERCMAKEPADRPGSMDEVVAELQACLAELDGRPDGDATMIVRPPTAKAKRPRRGPTQSRRTPLLLALVLLALLAAAATAFALLRDDPDGSGTATPAGGTEVALKGVAAYDPDGGDGEHDDEAASRDGRRPGHLLADPDLQLPAERLQVGRRCGARRRRAARAGTACAHFRYSGLLRRDPGGAVCDRPFETVSGSKAVNGKTTWELDGTEARYYVVWITELIGSGHVNEVTAR